jgi:3-oxoadipate enol-lactonase
MTEVALHAVVSGADDAPAVVLGPSLGTTVDVWEPQLSLLEKDFRVIRFDHRGHDGADVAPGPYTIEELGADVVRLLDSLHISRAHYAGVSLGAMIGMYVAAHAPDRIDRLALVCTSAYLPPASGWLERAETVRSKGTAVIAGAVVSRWFTEGFQARNPDVIADFTEQFTAVPAEGYAGCCEAIAAMDLRDDLAAVRAPTLVIAGADDAATPPPHGEEVARRINGARMVCVEEAAHLANVEQPAEIGRLIVEHLGEP